MVLLRKYSKRRLQLFHILRQITKKCVQVDVVYAKKTKFKIA
jgi:hypothetical protein